MPKTVPYLLLYPLRPLNNHQRCNISIQHLFVCSSFDLLQLLSDPWVLISEITASYSAPGWWFGTFVIFPYIEKNHPNWRFHIFQRGRYTTNQCSVTYDDVLPGDSCAAQGRYVQLRKDRVRRGTSCTWIAHAGATTGVGLGSALPFPGLMLKPLWSTAYNLPFSMKHHKPP